MSMKMKKRTKKDGTIEVIMDLRVLGYITKTKEWAAHCLETDLVGFGKTFDEALEELKEITEMQISFAIHKNETALLDHPAPMEILELWNRAMRWEIEHLFQTRVDTEKKYHVKSIPVSRPNRLDSCFVTA